MRNVIQFNNLDFGNTGRKITVRDIDLDQYGYVDKVCVTHNNPNDNPWLQHAKNYILNNTPFNPPPYTANSYSFQNYSCIVKHIFELDNLLTYGKYMYIITTGYIPTGSDPYAVDTIPYNHCFLKINDENGTLGANAAYINDNIMKYYRIIDTDTGVMNGKVFDCVLYEAIINIDYLRHKGPTEYDNWTHFAIGCVNKTSGNGNQEGTMPFSLAKTCIDKPILKIINEL